MFIIHHKQNNHLCNVVVHVLLEFGKCPFVLQWFPGHDGGEPWVGDPITCTGKSLSTNLKERSSLQVLAVWGYLQSACSIVVIHVNNNSSCQVLLQLFSKCGQVLYWKYNVTVGRFYCNYRIQCNRCQYNTWLCYGEWFCYHIIYHS